NRTLRFHTRKRNQAPAVIILDLIDILIVFLIFLIVTNTFKQQQQPLKVALPESPLAGKLGAQESPPLVVTVDAKGSFRLDKTPVTLEQLKPALAEAVAKKPDTILSINSDEGAPIGSFLKV